MKLFRWEGAVDEVINGRRVILFFWAVFICGVVAGSLSPADSPLVAQLAKLHVSDKVLHGCAYLILSWLPAFGFRSRRAGLRAGISMFILGALLEIGQCLSPGRAVELGDAIANTLGVLCGVLLAQWTVYGRTPLTAAASLSEASLAPTSPPSPPAPSA